MQSISKFTYFMQASAGWMHLSWLSAAVVCWYVQWHVGPVSWTTRHRWQLLQTTRMEKWPHRRTVILRHHVDHWTTATVNDTSMVCCVSRDIIFHVPGSGCTCLVTSSYAAYHVTQYFMYRDAVRVSRRNLRILCIIIIITHVAHKSSITWRRVLYCAKCPYAAHSFYIYFIPFCSVDHSIFSTVTLMCQA